MIHKKWLTESFMFQKTMETEKDFLLIFKFQFHFKKMHSKREHSKILIGYDDKLARDSVNARV